MNNIFKPKKYSQKEKDAIIRQTLKKMEQLCSAFAGEKIKIKKLENDDKALAYTDVSKLIRINPNHYVLDQCETLEEKVYAIQGVVLHELGHILFTDMTLMEKITKGFNITKAKVRAEILNIVEDSAIEYRLTTILSDKYVKCLQIAIATIYKNTQNVEFSDDALSQIFTAMLSFGDVGVVKGHFTNDTARKLFYKILPIFDSAIEDTNAQSRYEKALEICEILDELIEEKMKEQSELLNLLGSLMDGRGEMSRNTSAPSMNNSGEEANSNGNSSSTPSQRRRKVTLKKVSREEYEEMQKNASAQEDDGVSDITIVYTDEDVKSETENNNGNGASIPVPQNNSNTSASSGSETNNSNSQSSEIQNGGENSKSSTESQEGVGTSGEKNQNDVQSASSSENPNLFEDCETEGNTVESSSTNDLFEDFEELSNENTSNSSQKGQNGDKSTENGENSAENDCSVDDRNSENVSEVEKENSEGVRAAKKELSCRNNQLPTTKSDYSGEKVSYDYENDTSLSSEEAFDSSEIDNFDINSELILTNEELNELQETFADDIENDGRDLERLIDEAKPTEISIEQNSSMLDKPSIKNIQVKTNDGVLNAYESYVKETKTETLAFSRSLEKIVKAAQEEKMRSVKGKINGVRLNNGHCSAKVFDRKTEHSKGEFAVFLAVDVSGSQCYNIEEIKKACTILAEAFGKHKIPLYLMGYTADSKPNVIDHYHFIKWKNTPVTRSTIAGLKALCCNGDGISIRYAHTLLKKRSEKSKLLLVLTDGKPNANIYRNGQLAIKDAQKSVRDANKDCVCYGIAVDFSEDTDISTLKTIYGQNFLVAKNAKEMIYQLTGVLKKKFKESLSL